MSIVETCAGVVLCPTGDDTYGSCGDSFLMWGLARQLGSGILPW